MLTDRHHIAVAFWNMLISRSGLIYEAYSLLRSLGIWLPAVI